MITKNILTKKPLLSICIPAYNRCDDLILLLDSIIEYGAIELRSGDLQVVVSDNASDDKTNEVVEKYASIHKNIIKIRNSVNLGFAANLNIAVEAGAADYCWLMGSDEIILPDSIRKIISRLDEHFDIIFGNAITHGKERHFLKDAQPAVYNITSTCDFVHFVSRCTEISSAFAFISTLVVKKKFWNSPSCTAWELAHPYTHMLRCCRAISENNVSILYLNDPLVITGHNINEFNASVLPHFELDLLTIRYIVEEIFLSRKDLLIAYGDIFSNQYKKSKLVKARIECSQERWMDLVPTLESFGYGSLILRKKAHDNIFLYIYNLSRKIRFHLRKFKNVLKYQ